MKNAKEINKLRDLESFQIVIPYLKKFVEKNPDSVVDYTCNGNNCLVQCFVCPSIMNSKLKYVRPIVSIDAAHLKSVWKGTLYIATVKSAMDEIFPFAFAITADNENTAGWKFFLENLKESCPILCAIHPRIRCNYFSYFTFISDRDKGLIDAVSEIFPKNHHVHCTVHIARNVLQNLDQLLPNVVRIYVIRLV